MPPSPVMTVRRAASVAALVAALAYLPALGNRFALDDEYIVERNTAAHSVAAALAAFDQPYWPPERGAGLYRPLVILSFAADWQLSGGSTAWLHAVNVAWHATATALLVPVLAVYVGVGAALAGAVLFAVHPVHVEAVANLVGRAELMAAAFLFASVLLARAARRRRAARRGSLPFEIAVLGAVALALLSKEHAAVAVAILALDDLATRPRGGAGLPWRTYAATLTLTVAWFLVRRAVEGNISFAAEAPTFVGLGATGRLSTMMPVVFVLLRLLVWPFDLSADYHPQVVQRLEHPTVEGLGGALVLLSLVALAWALWRRNRAVSVGLFLIGIAWLPTSNLFFPTGVVIAERTLYLASAGAALIAAEGVRWLAGRWGAARAAAATLIVLVPFAGRTATAIQTWRSNRNLVLYGLMAHPESYRVHEAAARVLVKLGDLPAALAEFGVSAELYPLEVPHLADAARTAADAGNARLARRFLELAERPGWNRGVVEWARAYVELRTGGAVALLSEARQRVTASPRDPMAARILAGAFLSLGQTDSARAVWPAFLRRGGSPFQGWLYRSSTFGVVGMPDSARIALDSCAAHAPDDPTALSDIGKLRALIAGADAVGWPLR